MGISVNEDKDEDCSATQNSGKLKGSLPLGKNKPIQTRIVTAAILGPFKGAMSFSKTSICGIAKQEKKKRMAS